MDTNHRGSNFVIRNAFDESLRESPIRNRYEVDKTLIMEKNKLFGETPANERRLIKDAA